MVLISWALEFVMQLSIFGKLFQGMYSPGQLAPTPVNWQHLGYERPDSGRAIRN
jgi:hypothetical protein